ncbi:MAG: hypothetical protein WCJ40_16220 [Planctomycetota bacterium]
MICDTSWKTGTASEMESMHEPLKSLTLPPGLDDVTGLVEIDMSAIVQVMSDHASSNTC